MGYWKVYRKQTFAGFFNSSLFNSSTFALWQRRYSMHERWGNRCALRKNWRKTCTLPDYDSRNSTQSNRGVYYRRHPLNSSAIRLNPESPKVPRALLIEERLFDFLPSPSWQVALVRTDIGSWPNKGRQKSTVSVSFEMANVPRSKALYLAHPFYRRPVTQIDSGAKLRGDDAGRLYWSRL